MSPGAKRSKQQNLSNYGHMKQFKTIVAWIATAALSATCAVSLQAADQNSGAKRRERNNADSSSQKQGKSFQFERAKKLIGKEVQDSQGQKAGKIDDIVADLESGRVLYVVIGSGGVLGAGEKKHAVAPQIFENASAESLKLTIDKEKLSSAPEFTKEMDKDSELGKMEFVSKVYDNSGQKQMWQSVYGTATTGSFNNVHKLSDLEGMKVKNSSDETMGKVENLVVDLPQGRIGYVILSPDSSLDLGDNLYALPPDAFTLGTDRKTLVSGITKDKLASAPHFTKDDWSKISDPSFASQVYQFYGKQAWFNTSGTSLQPTGRPNSPDSGSSEK